MSKVNPRTKLKGTTVLVTGGAGFIGSHLIDRLISYGAKVICFDNLSTGSKEYVDSQKNNKKFIFIKGDVNKRQNVATVFKKYKIDYVMHYAALVGVQRTVEEPMKVLEDIEGIKHILDLSRTHKVKKIAYASSSEIYGDQELMPLHEDHSYYDIKMPYALVKAAGENYFRTFWEINGMPVVILRFFNVYGPRQACSVYGFVTGVFISQVIQNKEPTIFHDGTQTRDFMYIDDNIEACIQALLNDKANGETLNIGTGKETTILTLAERIIKTSGKKIKPSLMHKRHALEIKRRVADTKKMRRILGFTLETPLDQGLAKTYKWYKDNKDVVLHGEKLTYQWRQKQIWKPKK